MFTNDDVHAVTGQWVRLTRTLRSAVHRYPPALVTRAWLCTVTGDPQPGLGLHLYSPYEKVTHTAFHLPADGTYQTLAGCPQEPFPVWAPPAPIPCPAGTTSGACGCRRSR